MAALNFPNSPSVNDIHTENGVSFKWNGTIWKKVGASYLDTTNLNVTGIGTFAGAVNIAGVLTYEDVKNVDSVGIITARTGLSVTAGDVVIPDKIVHAGDTNTAIRFPSADTVTIETAGSEAFRVDSGGDTSFSGNIQIPDTIQHEGDVNTKIRFPSADTFSVETAGSERLRITSAGDVGINTTSPARIIHAYESTSNNLLFLESGEANVDIIQADTGGSTRIRNSQGSLIFYVNGDANASNAANSVTGLTIDGDKDVHVYDDLFIPDKIIHEGDTNTAIRFPATDTISFETSGSERLRITSTALIQCGTSGVLKAEINNAVSGHQFISQCDNNQTGFEVFQQHGSTATRNTFACFDNRTGSKKPSFAVRGDGAVVIDTTANGYGGLKIYDDSGGDYNVRYVAGRNQGACAHVFMRGGRTQNQSPWADATPTEHARIHRSGISFHGDTADANTLNDYEEGSFTPQPWSAAGSISYSHAGDARQGKYTKIGNLVYYVIRLQLSSVSTANGQAFIIGLPFTASSRTGSVDACHAFNINFYEGIGGLGGDTSITGRVASGQSYILLQKHGDGSSASAYSANDWSGNWSIYGSGCYHTDS